jgi:tetratricopeptide (TPR) repeat protein
LLGDTHQAIEIQTALLAQVPQDAKGWLSLGHALRTDGRNTEAIAAYRRAADVRPGFGDAYFSLANLKTFRFSSDEITAMRAQCARPDIGAEDRWHFEFALGKALEDAQDFAGSFAHYAQGNSLRRTYIGYDQPVISAQILHAMQVFTPEFFGARRDWGAAASDPIFIVGLPRSGSTLLEQILASHSAVEGTRELPDISAFANELGARKLRPGEVGYPDSVALLTAAQALDYGERYLVQTRPYRFRGAAHFIDKMPNNFVNLGLIHLILPNARIIDARRHPLACGFAVFKQLFNQGFWYSYSLEEIGRYYRDYVAVMAHFDRVLPGRVLRVHYEKLVADPEAEIRRLLDYCGLPFEDSCLRFHENRRVVQTASSEQVRRPIYTEALDQWRNFEPWLGPLREALGDVVERYPDSL